MRHEGRSARAVDIPGLDYISLLVEVLSLVRARNALSWRFLPRTRLHALVLGGSRKEGAGLLLGSGLTDAAHDVGDGMGGARQT
jgi:hypothetical protein